MFTQAQEVIDFIEKEEIAYIDVRFCDLPGVQQHFTIPASELQASVFGSWLHADSRIRYEADPRYYLCFCRPFPRQ